MLKVSAYKYWKDLSELARIEMARLEGRGLTDLGSSSKESAQGVGEEQHVRSEKS